MAHACNPSTLGGWGGQITRGQEFKTSPTNVVNPVSTKKNTKISWAWWWPPVIPATQEAEAGELFELGRQRLQWVEIGWQSETLSQKKKKKTKKKKERKSQSSHAASNKWQRQNLNPGQSDPRASSLFPTRSSIGAGKWQQGFLQHLHSDTFSLSLGSTFLFCWELSYESIEHRKKDRFPILKKYRLLTKSSARELFYKQRDPCS